MLKHFPRNVNFSTRTFQQFPEAFNFLHAIQHRRRGTLLLCHCWKAVKPDTTHKVFIIDLHFYMLIGIPMHIKFGSYNIGSSIFCAHTTRILSDIKILVRNSLRKQKRLGPNYYPVLIYINLSFDFLG